MENNHLYALILAGGSGTRLWPKSRKATPKHLLKLHSDEQSMLAETAERIMDRIPPENIFVVTRAEQAEAAAKELPTIPRDHIIAEPMGKNTAWAMGFGSYMIAQHDPDAVVINLAADHVITDKEALGQAIDAAHQAARLGDYLVTIGIVPTAPHTGYGYIKIGEQFTTLFDLPVYKVTAFTEKPDLQTAQEFVKSQEYFWNANLYTWHVSTIKAALHAHAPHVAEGLDKIMAAFNTDHFHQTVEEVYNQAEETQIDKGVSEKATNLLMVPGKFGWNDIGDWGVLYDIKVKEQGENVTLGEVDDFISIDTKGTLVHGNGKLVATIGLENVVIIDTPNALLVCTKDRVQDVKKIVDKLKAENKIEYL